MRLFQARGTSIGRSIVFDIMVWGATGPHKRLSIVVVGGGVAGVSSVLQMGDLWAAAPEPRGHLHIVLVEAGGFVRVPLETAVSRWTADLSWRTVALEGLCDMVRTRTASAQSERVDDGTCAGGMVTTTLSDGVDSASSLVVQVVRGVCTAVDKLNIQADNEAAFRVAVTLIDVGAANDVQSSNGATGGRAPSEWSGAATAKHRVLHAHRVCICTGARPRHPPLSCNGKAVTRYHVGQHVHVLRGESDARTFVAALRERWQATVTKPQRRVRVAIVGNGAIALDVVHALCSGGSDVTWFMRDESFCSTFFSEAAGAFLLPYVFGTTYEALVGTAGAAVGSEHSSNSEIVPTVPVPVYTGGIHIVDMSDSGVSDSIDSADVSHAAGLEQPFSGPALGPGAAPVVAQFGELGPGDGRTEKEAPIPWKRLNVVSGVEVVSIDVTLPESGDTSGGSCVLTGARRQLWKGFDLVLCATGVVPNVSDCLDIRVGGVSCIDVLQACESVPIPCNFVGHGVCEATDGKRQAVCKRPAYWVGRTGCDRGGFGVGIHINTLCETAVPGLFAAGDCASTVCMSVEVDTSMNKTTVDSVEGQAWLDMRLWTQAHGLGRVAALGLLGMRHLQDASFACELFAHTTHLGDKRCTFLGLFNKDCAAHRIGCPVDSLTTLARALKGGDEFVELIIFEGVVIGATVIGDSDMVGVLENLILNQTNISMFGDNLLDPNVDLDDYFD